MYNKFLVALIQTAGNFYSSMMLVASQWIKKVIIKRLKTSNKKILQPPIAPFHKMSMITLKNTINKMETMYWF